MQNGRTDIIAGQGKTQVRWPRAQRHTQPNNVPGGIQHRSAAAATPNLGIHLQQVPVCHLRTDFHIAIECRDGPCGRAQLAVSALADRSHCGAGLKELRLTPGGHRQVVAAVDFQDSQIVFLVHRDDCGRLRRSISQGGADCNTIDKMCHRQQVPASIQYHPCAEAGHGGEVQGEVVEAGDAEEIASRIPTAELVIISGGAHGLHIEHATTFNRILLEFLARAEKSHVPHGAAAREAV